ncbi:MAG: transcriptional regulator, LysR family [Ilumatobacteraceae bacterium]|nr:transcriptional regulator, LysR family [Ilumatobacteraceae bacterium]
MISVVQAQCVVAVARMGSFRKAAAALFMAQPAVSANVDKVERTLRIELFDRTNSGATLTSSGVTLLPHFQALLASHESVMLKSAQIKSGDEPILRIASHRMGQVIILPPALNALRASSGGSLAVDITHAADETHTSELVKTGQVELGLGIRLPHQPNQDSGLYEVVTATLPVVIYCRADHPFACLGQVSVEAVAKETIVSTRSAAGERLFQRQFGMFGDVSRVLVDDAQIALQMVSDGVGVAPLVGGLEAMVSVPVVSVLLASDVELSSTVMKRAGEPLSATADALWRLLAPGKPPL